jgi:DNA-binding NtrC family response regulator
LETFPWKAVFISEKGRGEMKQIQLYDKRVRPQPIPYKPKPRILVVDDDLEVAGVLRDILENESFNVEIAGNGRQALKFLKDDQCFDLLITDMRMPEVDGLELLREIYCWNRHLPVIVLTGYPTVRNGIQSIREGAYDYLAKPFETEALLNVVQSALQTRPPA